MKMSRFCAGMSLVEIILTAALIAVLAAFIIPPIHHSKTEAQKKECFANIVALNAQIELYQAQQGSWPESLTNLTNLDYIEKLPVCPLGEKYIYNASTYKVMQHAH